MATKRIIPILQMINGSLVKTVKFSKFRYIGDPVNTVRIFNELFVDEMTILDIRASVNKSPINFKMLNEISQQCFVPLSYGGAITSLADAETLYAMGFEKLIINSALFEAPTVVKQIVNKFGSQAVIASIDVRSDFLKRQYVCAKSGTKRISFDIDQTLSDVESLGVGELLITDVCREGTGTGLNLELGNKFASNTNLPVILHGGANDNVNILHALSNSEIDAVGVGTLVVMQNHGGGVLVNYSNEFRDFLWQY